MASLSSTGSVSSSNSLGNTSLRGFGGMVSGIDRDSIIEQMTLGTTTKINNVKSDITKLQWKQEAYRSLSDQILDITDKYTSFSSSTSLLDPMTFAKSIITVEGSDKSSKYVKATGTSDMIDTIALEGVEKLASSAVQQSGIKQSEKGLVTGLSDLDKDISVSKLNNGVDGRRLTIGLYNQYTGWSNQTTFTFPTQYQARSVDKDGKEILLYDENGNKVMKNIDYTSDDYKTIAQQLNWALEDSSESITINGKSTKLSECIKFEYNETTKGMELANKGGLGEYKINTSASTALSALGYSGNSGAISLGEYNDGLSSFADSSVTRMSVLDALTGAKVNFNYNGSTKEVVLVTAADKEKIKGITLGDGEDSLEKRAKNVADILGEKFGLTAKEVSDLQTKIDEIVKDDSKTDKETELESAIKDAIKGSKSFQDAVEKETKDRIVANAGISRDEIKENYIKEVLTNVIPGKDYDTLLDEKKSEIRGERSDDELAKALNVDKDKVAKASGLNIDDLAASRGITWAKVAEEYKEEFEKNLPDEQKVDTNTFNTTHEEEITKKYKECALKAAYGEDDPVKNEKAHEDAINTAYEKALNEALTAKATDELTADAYNIIANEMSPEKLEDENLGIVKTEGMSDEDYVKALKEAYAKREIESVTSTRYQAEVDEAVAAARTGDDSEYSKIETEVSGKILDNTFETAKKEAVNNELQKLKLAEMAELLNTRLDKAFGTGNVTASVDEVTGKLIFKAGSDNTSLSITTGSSGSNVLGNMGIISGASNKVNLAGNLTQDSLALSADALAELDEGGVGLMINGTKIEGITKNSTINDIISKINKSDAGVKATYVQSSGQFMLVSSETGQGRQIDLSKSQLAKELFGQGEVTGEDGKTRDKGFKEGEDAIIHVNYGNGMSVVLSSSSNTFNLEGLNVTVTNEFGGTKAADGTWQADPADRVTFSAKADVDAVTEKVKSFFEDFNKLVTETYNQLTTRSDSDYGPLTDEQKAEMSETSIENWEKKAKEGILYNDSIIRDLNSTLESFLTQLMNSGIKYQDLESIGITYDESWSGGASTIVFNESKFRSAMENNSDLVSDIFTGTGKVGGTGLVKTVENMLTPYATRVASKNRGSGSDRGSYGRLIEEAGSEKVPTSALNNFIYQQIKEMNEKIQTLQAQLKTKQERYIKQFTNMETLINQYNSQSGYLSQITG